jgi:plasmid stabilization system protein ParE
MNSYLIKYSSTELRDIDELFHVIANQYKAPLSAFKYVQGLKDTISQLKRHPDALQLNHHKSFEKYGPTVRRINYKRMAIIYDISENAVYIHRILAASTISDQKKQVHSKRYFEVDCFFTNKSNSNLSDQ